MKKEVKMVLKDIQTGKSIGARIVNGREGNILIAPEGYGEHTSNDGEGFPILLELHDGKVKLYVWGDINKEDPTDIIDLTPALEKNRKSS